MTSKDMSSKPDSVPAQHQREQPGIEQKMTPKPQTIRENYRGSGKLEDASSAVFIPTALMTKS